MEESGYCIDCSLKRSIDGLTVFSIEALAVTSHGQPDK